jgi:hypothetical protein
VYKHNLIETESTSTVLSGKLELTTMNPTTENSQVKFRIVSKEAELNRDALPQFTARPAKVHV